MNAGRGTPRKVGYCEEQSCARLFRLIKYPARKEKGKQWASTAVHTSAPYVAGARLKPALSGSNARDTGGTTAG